jgi:mRNA interferase MazF
MLTNTVTSNEIKDLNWRAWTPKRGEIYLVDLGQEGTGSEQKGLRPFLILSNNIGNAMGSIVVGMPITSKNKGLYKIHVPVGGESGIKLNSFILTEHIRSISKKRFFNKDGIAIKLGQLNNKKLVEVEEALKFELGFISQ